MIESLERDAEVGGDDLSAAGLLASIRSAHQVENAAAAEQLWLAARWADLHPPESIHTAASFVVAGCEHEEPIAGPGTPLVAEFCLADLGAVLGTSTTSAKRLVGHALELRHRLPRLSAGVQAGLVPAWRARAVAEATIHATPGTHCRSRGVRRRAGRRRRRTHRSGPARPARCRGDQAALPRRHRRDH